MFSFFALIDQDFILNEWEISSQNECHPFNNVFQAYPYRDNKQLLATDWNSDSFTIKYCGDPDEKGKSLFITEPGVVRYLSKGKENIINRSSDDIGFKYQIDWEKIQNLMGPEKFIHQLGAIIDRQSLDTRRIVIPEQPYILYLSKKTLYFHDVEEAFVLFLDILLSNNWRILENKNVVLCPSMVPPETNYLPLLTTIDWLCSDHNIHLFITTLDKVQLKYLRHSKFIEICENFMHRSRIKDFSDLPVLNRYPYFMSWDSNWHPDMKGMKLILELFMKYNIKDKLYIKIPDGYPNNTVESEVFYTYIKEYQQVVDIELVTMPEDRKELLQAFYQEVEVFIYVCYMDGGPRTVFELAGMNKKILFYDRNDCNIIKHGLLDKYRGFIRFNKNNFQEKYEEISEEKYPETVRYFDEYNWMKTRDIFREETGDQNIKGFWFDCFLVLDQV
ncbi:MAG: hypothetical protein QF852_03320 [Candidatus Marinimicrobia bacterium]|jgi:hypothetical protein|nr:hypothetical protein [Candidatus Neomarinimicrobiota bacterium]MDP6134026.1 hypothetical protein [Candidatus Neomarinimicrobiota bacterium]MDP6260729.1 hypothetical protein [Candidatus Neomarinimicrobiota bacterium]MDP7526637.1 hypothetical protein [Candidatus Neomarinimicrobiota bacterium]|tara:strand:- start:2080 stop:3417 length:1338 start_codon:yes stop_codon:yes gene_type:complete